MRTGSTSVGFRLLPIFYRTIRKRAISAVTGRHAHPVAPLQNPVVEIPPTALGVHYVGDLDVSDVISQNLEGFFLFTSHP